jgi:hypothetical protein
MLFFMMNIMIFMLLVLSMFECLDVQVIVYIVTNGVVDDYTVVVDVDDTACCLQYC